MVADPPTAFMFTACCQLGIGHTVLTPPPLPDHVVSDCQAPPAPAVVKLVPPTEVMFGSSAGGMTAPV